MRVSKDNRSIPAGERTDKVVKGRRVRDARRKILEIPEVTQCLQDGGGTVIGSFTGSGIDTLILNVTRGAIGRDKPSRQTATETIILKCVLLAIRRLLGVGKVIRTNGERGSDMVEETTGLVEGEQEESLIPLGTGAEGVVDLLDEDLAVRDVTRWMHGVGVQAAAGRVDVGELRQDTEVGVLVEVLEGDDVLLGVLLGPVEEKGVRQEGTVRAVVVAPGDALVAGDFEDASNIDRAVVEVVVVTAVACGCARDCAETVWVGGLYYH